LEEIAVAEVLVVVLVVLLAVADFLVDLVAADFLVAEAAEVGNSQSQVWNEKN
jgi:hypothetical protein